LTAEWSTDWEQLIVWDPIDWTLLYPPKTRKY